MNEIRDRGRPTGIVKIAVVVPDVERAVAQYGTLLGVDGWSTGLVDSMEGLGAFSAGGAEVDLKASIAWVDLGGVGLELIQPLDKTSEFSRFLEENGPGVHHVALDVTDYEGACANLSERGATELLSADVLGTKVRLFRTVAVLGIAVSFATTMGEL